MPLVNAKHMVDKAFKEGYAVPHININNLEWTKAALIAAQNLKSPIILATSESAVEYMGGLKTIYSLVVNLIESLSITVPVALHLDHGTYEMAIKAIKCGYTSVMYDGSHEPFSINYVQTKKLAVIANLLDVSVECEVGSIGGEEDGVVGIGEIANPLEASWISELGGVSFLAAGIGNIHGVYPNNWKGLDFEALKKIRNATDVGLVLHGGSGIPKEQIQKAISMGIAKVNVNTEIQLGVAKALENFILTGSSKIGKNYDFRKMFKDSYNSIIRIVEEKIHEFGSANKAF